MENTVKLDDLLIKTNSNRLEEVKGDYPASIIHHHDTNKDDLYIGEDRVTDNFNIGNMSEDTPTIKVGGLDSTTLGDLKTKSMSEIIMNMICPLTYPTKSSNPNITISYSGSGLVKVGTVLPLKSDMTVSAYSGIWSDGTSYYGTCGDVVLSMNPDKWGEKSEENIYSISGNGTFSAGGMSKDSHGNDYKQMSGGNVTSNTIKITSVYPIYINNGTDITEMKENIVDYITGTTFTIEIPAEVDGTLDKFKIYLPSVFSTFEVKQYSDLTGKYDIDVDMSLLDGETSKYIRTNDMSDTNTGSAKYEIKLKK